MSNVILFQPKSQHDAKANLVDFIEFAKRLKPLGVDQPFANNRWSAGKAINLREGSKETNLVFTKLVEINGKLQKRRQSKGSLKPMEEPFLSFAKAMICYSYAVKPRTSINVLLFALRHLYVALLRTTGSLCPSGITTDVLNLTCQLLMKTYKTPYNVGVALQNMYATMTEARLVAIPAVWNSFIPNEHNANKRSGKEFDAARNKKLPNPSALNALAYIFNHPKDNGDIAATSVSALLLCDPDRIVEVITGPLDCIAREGVDVAGNSVKGLYLRWHPAKNGDPLLKPVIPSMAEVARRAIGNLRKLGAPARELARWYEDNPNRIYLPPHLEHLRSKPLLSKVDLNAILFDGKREIDQMGTWVKINMPEYGTTRKTQKRPGEPYISFAVFEKLVLAMLPVGFPVLNPTTGVKYSEALCICRLGELTDAPPFLCVLQPINYEHVAVRIGGRKAVKSIFDKHGLTDEKGDPLFVKSHMFRHYLTMVGKAGGLSDIESNKWAGRANATQMRTYNSLSDRDVLANIRNAVARNKPELGPLANMDNRMFINRAEFANIRVISAHTTDLGHCVHDFGTVPCPLHGDHINCNEHVVIKGEVEQEKNLRCLQAETCALLKKAKTGMSEGEYGASMWVDDHTKKLERINQIIQILDDPNTPIGAVIQPSGIVPPSRLKQAMEGRLLTSGAPLFGGTIRSMADVHAILGKQIPAVGGAHG
jgi:hypothetical protein